MFKRTLAVILLSFCIATPTPSPAFWGGNPADTMYLAQLVANALKQLIQLKNMLATAKHNLELVRNINKGIDEALAIFQTLNPDLDPGIYKDWRKVDQAIRNLEKIYGVVTDSPLAAIQTNLDRVAAEAITKNNKIYDYTKKIDQIGENIKAYSKVVSPKGAQKLTAQSMGVMLHVMNESLRAQATGLKLQAQSVADHNRAEKDRTREILKTTNSLKGMMKSYDPQFDLPRFK